MPIVITLLQVSPHSQTSCRKPDSHRVKRRFGIVKDVARNLGQLLKQIRRGRLLRGLYRLAHLEGFRHRRESHAVEFRQDPAAVFAFESVRSPYEPRFDKLLAFSRDVPRSIPLLFRVEAAGRQKVVMGVAIGWTDIEDEMLSRDVDSFAPMALVLQGFGSSDVRRGGRPVVEDEMDGRDVWTGVASGGLASIWCSECHSSGVRGRQRETRDSAMVGMCE